MKQLELKDIQHVTHKDDPITSKIAIAKLESSGKRYTQAMMVYEIVRDHPDLTPVEMEAFLPPGAGFDYHEIRKRLHEMKGTDLIVSGRRHCRVKTSLQQTWRVATPETRSPKDSA